MLHIHRTLSHRDLYLGGMNPILLFSPSILFYLSSVALGSFTSGRYGIDKRLYTYSCGDSGDFNSGWILYIFKNLIKDLLNAHYALQTWFPCQSSLSWNIKTWQFAKRFFCFITLSKFRCLLIDIHIHVLIQMVTIFCTIFKKYFYIWW